MSHRAKVASRRAASGIEEAVVRAANDPILVKMLEEERVESSGLDTALLGRVMGYLRPHLPLAIGSVLLAFGEALVMALPAYVIGFVIDQVTGAERQHGAFGDLLADSSQAYLAAVQPSNAENAGVELVTFFAIIVALVWCFRWLVGTVTTYLVNLLGQRIVHDLRMEVHRHIVSMDATFFQNNPVGRLVNRTTFDVASLLELFRDAFAQGMRDALFVAVLMAVMVGMDFTLASVLLLSLPVLVGVLLVYRHYARPAMRTASSVVSRMNAWLAENLAGMRENQLYRAEHRRRAEFEALTRAHQRAITRVIQSWGFLRPAMMLTTAVATALVLLIGYERVTVGVATVGVLLTFLQYTVLVWRPIRNLSEKFNLIQTALTSGERVFDILDARSQLTTLDSASPDLQVGSGSVAFESVSFKYPGHDDNVLEAVDFDVESGEMLALVGDTGAGKSTIIKLMSRFHDVQHGSVKVDGHDVRDYTLANLRRGIALVPQDVVIFAQSVRDNITLGRDVSDERIRECLRAVRADQIVDRLPDGLDTELDEEGRTLSTGERQLLSFARALVINPPVLILDEATANVDTNTEILIQEALANLTVGRTSIVIAHRLSTIRNADKILVLKDGQLIERGNHESLLAMDGAYATLHRLHYGA